MIKQRFLVTLMVSLWWMTGCSQTAPSLQDNNHKVGNHNITDSVDIVGDTVMIDERSKGSNGVSSEGTKGAASANITSSGQLSGVALSKFNSSSNGFKSIYFGFDQYQVTSDMEGRMQENISRAKALQQGRIKLEGNCDEFGTDEYNYALGLKRAKAVKDALVDEGVASRRIVIVSYGESNPVCTTHNHLCYARNRRVDLHLTR